MCLLTWQTTVDDREAPAELFKIPTRRVAVPQHFPSSIGARIPGFFQVVDVLHALQGRLKAILAEELASLDMNGLAATRSSKVYVVCQDKLRHSHVSLQEIKHPGVFVVETIER